MNSSFKRKGEKFGDWEVAFKKIRANPCRKTIDQVRDEIVQQSAGDPDVIAVERPKLSLICPISGKRVENAARGMACAHLHCFDLAAFLKQQSQTPFWDCPFSFCEQRIQLEDIVVDEYFNYALQATDAAVKEIEVVSDGSFLPAEVPKVLSNTIDDSDDNVDARNDDDPSQVSADSVHVVSAKVLRELNVALRNVGDQLDKLKFAYLNHVKESFGGLRDLACEHFFVDEKTDDFAIIPTRLSTELHARTMDVFRRINDLGSKEWLNCLAHDLVELNSLIKQRVIGSPKLIL